MHLRDLGFGWQRLAKRPMFAVTAIATLALAIGANTAIFAVVHSVLLAPLPFPAPDRLVRISGGSTVARYEAMRRADSFAGVGAYLVTTGHAALPGSEGAESVRTAQVSTNFLSVLAIQPIAGRGFLPEEEQAGVNVAMIGSRLWTQRFGSEPRVVGATIALSGVPHTVVGVLPPDFRFPFDGIDVWRPLQPMAMPEQQRVNSPVLQLFGRLRDGVPFERAATEVRATQQAYALSHPGLLDARPDRVGTVVRLHDALVGDSRSTLWILFGAAGLVAAIACANVAGLLLAQALARSREFAIRIALGAARARLIRQLLWESAILAAGGVIVGVPLAIAGVRVIAGLDALALPRAHEVAVDRIALAFAVALSALTVMLFGLAPAIAASRTSAMAAMRRGDAGTGRLLSSPRGILVSAQIALSVMLTAGTAMLALSLIHLHAVDPGFQTANVLTMRVGLPRSGVNEFLDELVRRTESLPGVRSAAVTLTLPMTGFAGTPVHAIGPPAPPLNERPIAVVQIVTPGYFDVSS